MRLELERFPDLRVLVARTFPDERGFLLQSWVQADLLSAGIPGDFKQAVQNCSKKGVVRGLHFQWAPPMGKLIRCVYGGILDVVVDVRHGSPTLGDHFALEMTGSNHRIFWVPPGFAHGFMALEENSIVHYECTAEHGPGNEGGILWNDPALGIEWPALSPIVSEKDRRAPTLSAWLQDPRSKNFSHGGSL